MFEYEKTGQYFAQCAGKMEDLALEEMREFGIRNIKKQYRGLYFKSDPEHVMRMNFRSRLLSRILAPIFTFDCHSEKYLYKMSKQIEWERILNVDNTFAIFANVGNSRVFHSQYATQVLKDSIADYFKEKYDKRPSVDRSNPDVWINLHIDKNRAKISIDTSGGPLHKRGYRKESVAAPMQETLAAAIIKISGWKGKKPLLDPFCGSGTLLSEALLEYSRIPTGFSRDHYGFEYLPGFDQEFWKSLKDDSQRLMRPLPDNLISGIDVSNYAIRAAETNLKSIPYGSHVSLIQQRFQDHEGLQNGVIVANPPYGIRLDDTESLKILYREFGDFLKKKCQGSIAYVYCGNRDLISHLRLRPSAKIPLVNGNLDGRLLKLEMF